MRWLTNLLFFIFISCSTMPPVEDTSETIYIPISLHLRTERDLEKAQELVLKTQEVFRKEGIEVYVVDIVFRDNDKLDIVGSPKIKRTIFDEDVSLDIYFVNTLYGKDTDDPYYGLHISRTNMCQNYIIIPEETTLLTMAHEIGHEFGLDHKYNPGNIMSGGVRRRENAAFTKEQIRTIKKNVLFRKDICS